MSIAFTVEGKVVGRKRPLFSDWHIELPPVEGRHGNSLKLRDLITSIVINEVKAFKGRLEERKLVRIMSGQEIEKEAEQGKVDR